MEPSSSSSSSVASVKAASQRRTISQDEATFLKLGGAAIVKNTKVLRRATLNSTVSHLNLLKYNGVFVDKLDASVHLNDLLDGLRTRKGKKLSPGYKLQIGNTLRKALNNEASYDPLKYRIADSEERRREPDPTLSDELRIIIDYAAICAQESLEQNSIVNLSMYDACLAILFTVSACMRIDEILQLTVNDMFRMLAGKPIYVNTKSRRTEKQIICNDLLSSLICTVIINREKSKRAAITTDNNMAKVPKSRLIGEKRIILTSDSQLYRSLRELSRYAGVRIDKLGFNKFRKFMVTELALHGKSQIAKFMNSHRQLKTTVDSYYIGRLPQMQRMQAKIVTDGSSSVSSAAGKNVSGAGKDNNNDKTYILNQNLMQQRKLQQTIAADDEPMMTNEEDAEGEAGNISGIDKMPSSPIQREESLHYELQNAVNYDNNAGFETPPPSNAPQNWNTSDY